MAKKPQQQKGEARRERVATQRKANAAAARRVHAWRKKTYGGK